MRYPLLKKRYFIFSLVGGLLLLVIAAYGSRFVQLRSNAAVPASPLILGYNAQLLSALSTTKTFTSQDTNYAKVLSIAETRKKELLKEMHSNPARFLSSIMPIAQRATLPSDLYERGLLEKEVTVAGTLSTMHGDPINEGDKIETRRVLTTFVNGKPVSYVVTFATPETNPSDKPTAVSLSGIALGNELLVSPQQRVTSTPGPSPTFGPSPTPPPQMGTGWPSTGNVKALVVTYTFEGNPLVSQVTAANIKSTVFGDTAGTVKTYFKDASRGRLQFDGDVTSKWYKVPSTPGSNCLNEVGQWMNQAYAVADVDYDMSQYQVFIFFNPTIPGCGFLGAATTFGSDRVWINGYNDASGYVHELGHAFSFEHAGSLTCGSKIIDTLTNCKYADRSDPNDPMGFGHSTEFNSAYKKFLGWLNPDEVTSVTTSGVYTLYPLENKTAGLKAISVRAADDPSDSNPNSKFDYYLEYRKKIGLDKNINEEGVQVRRFNYLLDSPSFHSVSLLDGSPGDSDLSTASISQGKSLVDIQSKVSIDVLNVTPDSARVLALLPDSEPLDMPPVLDANSWLIRLNAVGCMNSAALPVQSFYTFWNISDPGARNLQLQTDLTAPGTHNIYVNRIPDNSSESYPTLPFYAGLRLANGETLVPVALQSPEYFYPTSPFQVGGGTPWFNEFWGVKWFNQNNGDIKGLPTGTYTVKFFTPIACNYALAANQRKVLSVTSQFNINSARSTSGMTTATRVYDQLGKPAAVMGMTACNDKGTCVPLSTGSTGPNLIPLGSGNSYKSGDWATITLNLPANSQYAKIGKRFCSSTSFCQFPSNPNQIKVRLESNKEAVYGWVLNKSQGSSAQSGKNWTFNTQLVCSTGQTITNAAYSVYSGYGTTTPTNWVTWPTSGAPGSTKSYSYSNVVIPTGQFGYINVGSGSLTLSPYGVSPNANIQYSTIPYTGNTRVRWSPALPSGSYTVKFILPVKNAACSIRGGDEL